MAKKVLPGYWQMLTRRFKKYVAPNTYRENAFCFDLGNDDPLIGLNSDNETLVEMIKVNSSNAVELPSGATLGAALALGAAGFTMPAIARTATATGDTTGTIASGPSLQFIAVSSSNADHIIVLPDPVPGSIVILANGATGYELRSTNPATIGINGGTGTNAESAIAANVTAVLICRDATNWVGFQMTSAGTVSAVQVAAP